MKEGEISAKGVDKGEGSRNALRKSRAGEDSTNGCPLHSV